MKALKKLHIFYAIDSLVLNAVKLLLTFRFIKFIKRHTNLLY